ncbi:MAG: glycosyltransferase family 2 protein [Candidatus Ratteibacteria bacterium]
MRITIFTPVYGRKNATLKTVESIHKNTNYPFEHVIINNNYPYPDGTNEILEDLKIKFKNIKLINNDINKGISLSYYQAMMVSDADLYIKIDNDIEIKTKNYLEILVEVYKNLGKNWFLYVLGGKVINLSYKFKIFEKEFINGYEIEWINHISSPFFSTPKYIIEKIGFSHPFISLHTHEDSVFTKKLKKNGFKIGRIINIEAMFLREYDNFEYKELSYKENCKYRYDLKLHNYIRSKIR